MLFQVRRIGYIHSQIVGKMSIDWWKQKSNQETAKHVHPAATYKIFSSIPFKIKYFPSKSHVAYLNSVVASYS